MRAHILIEKDHQAASALAAKLIAGKLMENPRMKVTFAAGFTPLECYKLLIGQQREGKVKLDQAYYVGLDEWIGLGPKDVGSCIETMNSAYYVPAGISPAQIAYFDGLCEDPKAEERRMCNVIADIGGIDLAVVGVGVNGHIGFNEPDTALQGDFSLVPLSETTQTVGMKYFNGSRTPKEGATMTLHALKRAKTVIVIATGEKKRAVAGQILTGKCDLPVGAFLEHPDAYYIFDSLAASSR